MSIYDPAHSAIVAIASDSSAITEATGGTPGTLPAIPSSPTIIGYMQSLPEANAALNNSKGYAVGVQGAAYNRLGSPRPKVSFSLSMGSAGFFTTYCFPTSGVMPYFAIYIGIGGVWTDVYRKCKVNDWALAAQEPQDGTGGEISATVNAFGLCRQTLGSPIAASPSSIRALGVPLMWHDVRTFSIASADYRRGLMGVNVTQSYNLEYKGQRPDDAAGTNPLSRCAYDMLEHHINAKAELTFHKRIPRTLFTGAFDSQIWGDIIWQVADGAAAQTIDVTMGNALVSDETLRGVQSGEQLSYTVPVELDEVTAALTLGA